MQKTVLREISRYKTGLPRIVISVCLAYPFRKNCFSSEAILFVFNLFSEFLESAFEHKKI